MARKSKEGHPVSSLLFKGSSYLLTSCTILSIALYTFEINLIYPVELAVSSYVAVRDFMFSLIPLGQLIEFLSSLIDIEITLVAPWEDVAVLLTLYTMVQVGDASNGALNPRIAELWRFSAGMFGMFIGVLLMSAVIENSSLSFVLPLIIGVTTGLLVFRILHPFQIGFDVGWKSLINKGNAKPETISQYFIFYWSIIKEEKARSIFFRKMSAVWKLSVWVICLIIFYLSYDYYTSGIISSEVEFFFIICFLITLCLFQVFMEAKHEQPNEIHIRLPNIMRPREYLYYSLTSGNYVIAKELFLSTITAFSLAYAPYGWTHISGFIN